MQAGNASGSDDIRVPYNIKLWTPEFLLYGSRYSRVAENGVCPMNDFVSQVELSGCAAISEAELAPLGDAPIQCLDLAGCWRFEVCS